MIKEKSKEKSFELPLTVVSLIDLSRLQREVEAVSIFLAQAASRTAGEAIALPRTTRNLEKLCQQNGINLLLDKDRTNLAEFLKQVRAHAPKVHISFASDPSAAFTQKITSWFRVNAHPLTLLQVGLQPTIAAGCIVRTTNKHFDLSIRKDLDKNHAKLVETIRNSRATENAKLTKQPSAPSTASPEYTFVVPKSAELTETGSMPVQAAQPEVAGESK